MTTPKPETSKTCKRCGETKPESAFHAHVPGRRKAICSPCRSQVRKGRPSEKESPEKSRWRTIERRYKITRAQYMALLAAQDGKCAICGEAPAPGKHLGVDHCHTTGKVRALLCTNCNRVVGIYENYHRAVVAYLATYGDGSPLLEQAESGTGH